MNDRELFEQHISAHLSDQILNSKVYYLRARAESDGSFKFISWNWAAFFGGLPWLVYRRLYKIALSILGINLIMGLLPLAVAFLTSIFIAIFLGAFGTTLYLQFIEKRIDHNQKPLGSDGFLCLLIFLILFSTLLYVRHMVK